MSRLWRIEYEGALYHVFSLGNNQLDIFITDDDRYLFLDIIGVKKNIDSTVKSHKSIQMKTDESGKIFATDSFMDLKSL